ncbi:MAG: hypothetical protein HRT89_20820, partial [Lentisphaeria bacterium]|nr:hypothetical protein [Lentisphaeria bacterium]
GVSLYEMLTGEVPYEGESAMVVIAKHVTVSFPDCQAVNDKIHDNTTMLLDKMVMKDPKDRHISWDVLISDIKAVLNNDAPPSIVPESEKSRFRKVLTAMVSHALTLGIILYVATLAGAKYFNDLEFIQACHLYQTVDENPQLKYVIKAMNGIFMSKSKKVVFDKHALNEWYRAKRYIEENPDRINNGISILKNLQKRYPGSAIEAQGEKKIAELMDKREKEIAYEIEQLKSQVEMLSANEEYDVAKSLIENYQGVYRRETATIRRQLMARLSKISKLANQVNP